MANLQRLIILIVLISYPSVSYSNPNSQWVILPSDAKDTVKQTIKSEVDKREGFSTPEEESVNLRSVETEKTQKNSAYKYTIAAANAEFNKAKKKRDDLTAQFQTASSEFEEFQKNINTIKATIENYDSQITRFDQDITTQQESLTKWLKTEKQGEAVVAVIYTRGFKDTAHELDKQADLISAPLMAEHMGVYVKSFTTVINNVMIEDFIKTIAEGTAKWTGEEPSRIELDKGSKGTIYLRIKRYELYPFQEPQTGRTKGAGASEKIKVAILTTMEDLKRFLSKNGYSSEKYDLSRVEGIIIESVQINREAEDSLNEQVRAFHEKITNLQNKIKNIKSDKELQLGILKNKEPEYKKMQDEIDTIRKKRDDAERAFHEMQAQLQDKKRVYESIIIKTALVTPKGNQTPADAVSETIIDKLEEVKNDARTQHSISTVIVKNFQLAEETNIQAITEANIIGVKLISFINEGDIVKVKMAFRVRTVLYDNIEKIGSLEDELEIKKLIISGISPPIDKQKVKDYKESSAVLVAMMDALSKFGELTQEITVNSKDTFSFNFSVDEFKAPLTIEGLCKTINADKYNLSLKSKDNTIDKLNELLKVPDFYDKLRKKKDDIRFSKDVMDLVDKTIGYRNNKRFSNLNTDGQTNIIKLNRLLLEETYPQETPKGPFLVGSFIQSQSGFNSDEFTVERSTVVKDFMLSSDDITLTFKDGGKFEINEYILKSFNSNYYNKFLSLFKNAGFEGEYGFYNDGTVFFNLTYTKGSIILVESKPSDVKVYINGTLLEKIPVKVFKAGQYNIEVKKDGYKTWTKTVKVEDEQLVTVKARLEEIKNGDSP